jgi:hypothetical protein
METLPNFTKGKHPRKGKKMKQGARISKSRQANKPKWNMF